MDLSGRGVVVSGERMRVAPLPHGAELWVGRFLIGCHDPGSAGGRSAALAPPPGRKAGDPAARPATRPAEDEVPLGESPPPDPAGGLSSSHILADAGLTLIGFGHPNGPVSGAFEVSGSKPGTDPGPAGEATRPGPEAVAAAEGIILPLSDSSARPTGRCSSNSSSRCC